MRLAAILALVAAMGAVPGSAQTFDNNSVIALRKAGLGDNALIAKIGNVPCGYDVSVDGLIALKQAGLSDNVIAAMVDRCNAAASAQGLSKTSGDPARQRPPGIYLLQDWTTPATMLMVRPSMAGAVKVSGNGSLLFPFVGRLMVPETKSNTIVKAASPSFFFYFDAADRKVSNFGSPNSAAAQSPEEFTLVRFKIRNGAREVGMGRVSALAARQGIDAKAAIGFTSEEIGDAIFKVTLTAPLPPGEYGFVLTAAGSSSRVYDFTRQ